MIIAFSLPAPEKLHYLCFPHTRLTLTAAGRSIFEQPSQSGVHDKSPPPPTPPCPHLAPTFTFSFRLLMGEGLIQASQLRSRPRKRLAPLRRLAAVDPPTLVGGKDRRGVRVRVRVHTCVCRDGVEFTVACERELSSAFLSVYCEGARRRKRPAGQTSKGLSHAAFLSNDRLEVTVCSLKWDRERNGDICSFVIFLHNRSCALRLSCAHRGSEGTTDAPHMG